MREAYVRWTDAQLMEIELLQTYDAMVKFAIAMLATLPQPVCQVCGPITTGGRGSFEENIKLFHCGIMRLHSDGRILFDQRPFIAPIQRLIGEQADYPWNVLEEFYLPVFKSGHIKEFHFLPGWESSFGAQWEYDRAVELNIDISYLSESLLELSE